MNQEDAWKLFLKKDEPDEKPDKKDKNKKERTIKKEKKAAIESDDESVQAVKVNTFIKIY